MPLPHLLIPDVSVGAPKRVGETGPPIAWCLCEGSLSGEWERGWLRRPPQRQVRADRHWGVMEERQHLLVRMASVYKYLPCLYRGALDEAASRLPPMGKGRLCEDGKN